MNRGEDVSLERSSTLSTKQAGRRAACIPGKAPSQKESPPARRLLKAHSGQAMVEFAVAAPLFLFMALLTIQMTLLLQAKFLVNYAVYCSARAGIVSGGDRERMEEAAAIALSPLAVGLGGADLHRRAERQKEAFGSGNRLEVFAPSAASSPGNGKERESGILYVRLTHEYELNVPLANAFLASVWKGAKGLHVPLTAEASMRMQND